MMKHTISIVLLVFLFCLTAMGQKPISLSEAIEIALANNYQIQIAERNIAIAETNNTLLATGRYPRVDFNLRSNNSYTRTNNPAGFIPLVNNISGGLTPSVDAQWIVFDGFKFRIRKNQLEQNENFSRSQTGIAVENTIRSVMLAYYQAIVQKEQLGVLESVLELDRERIKNDKIRAEYGQGGRFAEVQSTDALLNDSTTYLIQTNTYENALRNLKFAMGVDEPGLPYAPSEALEDSFDSYALADLKEKMLADNNSLKQLYINSELAKLNVDLQASDRYPTISLNSGISFTESVFWQSGTNPFTQEAFGSDFSNNLNFYVNGALTYPIYDAGARKRNKRTAEIEADIARLNIEDLKRSLESQLEIALADYENRLEILKLTERLIDNAQENLGIAEERFKGAQISSFDYRTIQLAYLNANQARLNALLNVKNAEIELIRLTGGLVR